MDNITKISSKEIESLLESEMTDVLAGNDPVCVCINGAEAVAVGD